MSRFKQREKTLTQTCAGCAKRKQQIAKAVSALAKKLNIKGKAK